MKSRLFIAAFALAGILDVAGYGPAALAQAPSGEPIKLGAVLSVTGVGAGLGVNERNGLILAERAINAKGGHNGRPIKIIIEDDTSNPDTAVTKVNDLIFNQKVIAIFGGSLLGPSVAMGGITDAAKLPQLTFTGLGPAVERTRKCVFHMLPPHELNARALFEYARSIGAKKVGVLHDTGYGNVVMRELNNVAGDYKDVQFVGLEKYEMAATDATAQAAVNLLGEILQEQGVHRALESNVQMGDVALGERDDVHAGERQALEQTSRVFLVAAEAVQRLGEHDIEPAVQRITHQRLEACPQ